MPTLPRCDTKLTIASFDDDLASTATCDLSPLRFIDAYGLVGTACALRAAPERALVMPAAESTRAHLSEMGFRGFLEEMGHPSDLPDISASDHAGVVVPLRVAADSGAAGELSNLLWQQLAEHVSPQVLNALAEGVWEMLANALEHSGSDAVIMGQVYRKPRGKAPHHDDRVQVVIGDTGRGIRASFAAAGAHSPSTDRDAIDHALEYLVSSVDDPGRGQGLSTTMEQVVETQGRMVIRSGEARIDIDASGPRHNAVRFLPGVIVALALPLYPG